MTFIVYDGNVDGSWKQTRRKGERANQIREECKISE